MIRIGAWAGQCFFFFFNFTPRLVPLFDIRVKIDDRKNSKTCDVLLVTDTIVVKDALALVSPQSVVMKLLNRYTRRAEQKISGTTDLIRPRAGKP